MKKFLKLAESFGILLLLLLVISGLFLSLGYLLAKIFPVSVFEGTIITIIIGSVSVIAFALFNLPYVLKEEMYGDDDEDDDDTFEDEFEEEEDDEFGDDEDEEDFYHLDSPGPKKGRLRGFPIDESSSSPQPKEDPIPPWVKPKEIDPDSPCPCGSGKKFKNCCGKF